ncbi:hypothetical protein TMEN_4963 [Trichophyton mentagrophytes]|nr:hypothetical protein TMEN_4963 [Trichophyton mentagrophytes]
MILEVSPFRVLDLPMNVLIWAAPQMVYNTLYLDNTPY